LLVRERENRERVAVVRHSRDAPLERLDHARGIAGRESREEPAELGLFR
jgi:hypothetical protein